MDLKTIFTQNAFLFMANRERILANEKMAFVPLPDIKNGLAYSGAFPTATLGTYIKWWSNYGASMVLKNDDTISFIWGIAGSPLSGSNLCFCVDEAGTREVYIIPNFRRIYTSFCSVLREYNDKDKQQEAYALTDVVDILKQDTTQEYYQKSLEDFFNSAKTNLINNMDKYKYVIKPSQP